MYTVVTKVYEEQDIEIPSNAIETHSSTTLEINGNIRTHQIFVEIQFDFECQWDVEKLNGKIVSINMTYNRIDPPHFESIFNSLINNDIDNSIPEFWRSCIGNDVIPDKSTSHIEVPKKPKPKRRILL